MLFVACVLLVLGLQCSPVLSTPHHKKQQRKYDREWKSKKRECLDNECKHFHPDENDNCLNRRNNLSQSTSQVGKQNHSYFETQLF